MDYMVTGVEFFQKGGAVMYVLLLCSMFVVAIGIERALYFNRMDSGRDFARVFYEQVTAGQYGEAAALLQNAHGVLAKIIIAAVQKENREQAAHYMELQSGIALSRMRQRLYYLSVIVTMAPLLGLLGTISGMISSFSVFNVASGQATAITGGVGEALIATAMGLCVAIAALAVHAYFSQRLENIITDMEQCFSLVEEHLVRLHKGAEPATAGQLVMEGGTL
ncbi:MAG: MotA/TolQ/ExbB proton channel family protein [Selenomonas ruminantium]|uniref:MotA/TolQ/ExbB proton channel family protein n=1 Tax=Selenomonas ruminantium TaxID=971 RepID=A0A927WKE7_SELRU|nr:MotA/TolQ/ExbB proton channel family protein [Selenomonas ruminantium]MBE6084802.1 MotA/TolQ/ExbB proton channel family protein [Selenomonas ruminantium]